MSGEKLVPKLRFSGFNDGWKNINLSDISKIKDGTHSSHKTVDDGVYLLSSKDVFDSKIHIGDDALQISCEDFNKLHKKFKIENEDILLTIIGSTCRTAVIEDYNNDYTFRSSVAIIKTSQNSYFLEKYFQTPKFINDFKKRTNVTAYESISLRDLSKINVNIPPISEQQKIANFLLAIEKKIELIKNKHESYVHFKKNLMQQIFTHKLRLDSNGIPKNSLDSSITADILGNLCNIQTGKLDANAMEENGKYRFYTCSKEYSYINSYAFDTEALLIAGNGEVGHIQYFKGKFNAYQRTYVLDNFDKNVLILYIKYYLEKYLPKQIWRNKQTGSMPYIVLSTLYDMKISYPPIQEQNKILNVLIDVDKKIKLINTQLYNITLFKKGLLQQMFV